jgi:FkbM family methyltransferase
MIGLAGRALRSGARRSARVLGYDLTPRELPLLARLGRFDVAPATVIDVGAATGAWSIECHRVFPQARYVLLEPLAEFTPALEGVVAALGSADHIAAAAAAEPGELTFNVHRDLFGSSLLSEAEGPAVDGAPRTVPVVTLDAIAAERGLAGPFLLKLDVQGAELKVLSGAESLLADAVAAVLEVSFFEFFHGGPLAHEVVAWMVERGFVIYDIDDRIYRPLDGALSQANVTFVQERGPFRSDHRYATPEQRAAQDAVLARAARR